MKKAPQNKQLVDVAPLEAIDDPYSLGYLFGHHTFHMGPKPTNGDEMT